MSLVRRELRKMAVRRTKKNEMESWEEEESIRGKGGGWEEVLMPCGV